MALPDASAPTDRSDIERLLREWPGGEHISVDAVTAGPYYLVPVNELGDTYWVIHVALRIYPGIEMPSMHDFDTDGVIGATSVHAVPKFIRDLLNYHNYDLELRVDDLNVAGPFQTVPGEAEFAALQANLVSDPVERTRRLAAAMAAASPVIGAGGVASFVLALGAGARSDPDLVADALSGFCQSPS